MEKQKKIFEKLTRRFSETESQRMEFRAGFVVERITSKSYEILMNYHVNGKVRTKQIAHIVDGSNYHDSSILDLVGWCLKLENNNG